MRNTARCAPAHRAGATGAWRFRKRKHLKRVGVLTFPDLHAPVPRDARRTERQRDFIRVHPRPSAFPLSVIRVRAPLTDARGTLTDPPVERARPTARIDAPDALET